MMSDYFIRLATSGSFLLNFHEEKELRNDNVRRSDDIHTGGGALFCLSSA